MSRMLLQVLSDAEIETLHEKTLEAFETVGVKITHEDALRKLKRAEAKVDEASRVVRCSKTSAGTPSSASRSTA